MSGHKTWVCLAWSGLTRANLSSLLILVPTAAVPPYSSRPCSEPDTASPESVGHRTSVPWVWLSLYWPALPTPFSRA